MGTHTGRAVNSCEQSKANVANLGDSFSTTSEANVVLRRCLQKGSRIAASVEAEEEPNATHRRDEE